MLFHKSISEMLNGSSKEVLILLSENQDEKNKLLWNLVDWCRSHLQVRSIFDVAPLKAVNITAGTLLGLCKVCRLWDNSDPPVCCSWCRWQRWGSQGWLWQQALHGTHWQEGRGNPGEQRGCWCFVLKSCSFRGTCRRRGLIALAGWRAHGRRRRRSRWWASLGVIGASSLSPWGGWCPDG